jgi:hypothetical protein
VDFAAAMQTCASRLEPVARAEIIASGSTFAVMLGSGFVVDIIVELRVSRSSFIDGQASGQNVDCCEKSTYLKEDCARRPLRVT